LQGVQIGERATQAAVYYAKDRVQSGKAIIEFPDVRRMLMRMKALTQGGRALLYLAASEVDRAHLGLAGAKTRLDILTPLAKSWGTDMGCDVASIGIQVHGGMGFVEETGAAQHYRDARIAPIYEGTNGIQAADLVGRKLTGDGGEGLKSLIADMRREAVHHRLVALINAVSAVTDYMLKASMEDRLAGSQPFLDMTAVAVAGWLLERQARVAGKRLAAGEGDPAFLKAKQAVAAFFLDCIVGEALGKQASAMAGADLLYAIDAEALAA
jgi:3-(methylthio)propanoyl-CoA dehydrogenase